MKNSTLQSLAAIVAILLVAAAIAWAGSQGGVAAAGSALPLFALCALVSFAINWAVFVPSYLAQTEHYFDLTGSLTYLGLLTCALTLGESATPRALLIAGLVALWAVRLGSFLFVRVKQDGADTRFDELKPDFARFLMTWTLQGLWCFLTLACGLAAMTAEDAPPLGPLALLGAVVFGAGFALEVTADRQKRRFRTDPANAGRFIQSGTWAWSRHPNYFGEITLWFGIALIALPALSGAQYATLISPVFVVILLTRISGIPLLESRGKKKWGDDPEYQAYKARTPVLIPRPPRTA